MFFKLKKEILFISASVILISLCLIGHFIKKEDHMPKTIEKFRTSVGRLSPMSTYDPTAIQFTTEYVIFESIYMPLVRMGVNGELLSGVAESFEWAGDEVRFKIRSDIKTIDGDFVTVDDAYFSLKRVLFSNTNSHGDLKTFLCPGVEIKSVESSCPGIRIENGDLILKVAKSNYREFLLRMLTNIDFAIIPKGAFSKNDGFPKIINFRKSSGPYYVDHEIPGQKIVMKANPSHVLMDASAPQEVELIKLNGEDVERAILGGEIDGITMFGADPAQIEKLKSSESGQNLTFFNTMDFQKLFMFTSVSQKNKFTARQRLAVHKYARDRFMTLYGHSGWRKSNQFIPALGEGSLSSYQQDELKALDESITDADLPEHFTFAAAAHRKVEFIEVFKGLPGAKAEELKVLPSNLPLESRPDFVVCTGDATFLESINLISYYHKMEAWALDPDKGSGWIADYMETEDKNARLEKFRDLHFETLKQGIMGVIGEAPYVIVLRKPFGYTGSKLYAGDHFWKIRRD
jgi:hypothetical protein